MGYCGEKKKRSWKGMQEVWIEGLKGADFNDLENYSFDDEWTVGDCEHSPLCQIIWGTIISDYFNNKYGTESFEFHINRYWMIVSDGEKSCRFLFDVMNNPKFNIGIDNPYEYHLIGNFAPIPGNTYPKRSLQFVHRDLSERWDGFLEYLEKEWDSFNMDFSFDDYLEMTCQQSHKRHIKRNRAFLIKQI